MHYTCKVCGEVINTPSSFCPYCGSPCIIEQSDMIDITDESNSQTSFVTDANKPSNTLRIIIACVFSISAILIILFLLIRRRNSPISVTPFTTSSSEIVASSFPETVPSETVASSFPEIASSSEFSSIDDVSVIESIDATASDEPLTAQTTLTAPDDLDNYHEISFRSGNASSILDRVNELYHYEPERAFDGDTVTSWQEGNKKTDGQGEWLELSTGNPCNIKYITLYLGNWRDKKRYEGNNRPTELQIDIGDKTFLLQFDDVMKPHYVIFSKPVIVSRIRFTFTKIKVGTNGDHDCCISEVRAFGLT